MSILDDIFSNQPLTAALVAWFFSQFFKFIDNILKKKEIDFKIFVSSGRFPSSHCAVVSALAFSIGINFGFESVLFALSAIMAGVVISDARGIRQSAGKQAEILNKIIEDLYQKRGLKIERLKEFLGHTPMQVFSGVLLGILTAFFLALFY